jgi:hypothetical protein
MGNAIAAARPILTDFFMNPPRLRKSDYANIEAHRANKQNVSESGRLLPSHKVNPATGPTSEQAAMHPE